MTIALNDNSEENAPGFCLSPSAVLKSAVRPRHHHADRESSRILSSADLGNHPQRLVCEPDSAGRAAASCSAASPRKPQVSAASTPVAIIRLQAAEMTASSGRHRRCTRSAPALNRCVVRPVRGLAHAPDQSQAWPATASLPASC